MAYVSEWESLSDATKRVMAATGRPKDEVQKDLCRAIADRVINIRGKLEKHTTRPMSSSDVLEGRDFEIPTTLKTEDLDCDRSRPKEAWFVRRGAYDPAGYWDLEKIELSRTDVTNALCTAKQPEGIIEHAPSEAGATTRSRPAPAGMIQGPMVRKVQLQVGQRGLVVCGQRNLRMRAALCGTIFNRAGERWRS